MGYDFGVIIFVGSIFGFRGRRSLIVFGFRRSFGLCFLVRYCLDFGLFGFLFTIAICFIVVFGEKFVLYLVEYL